MENVVYKISNNINDKIYIGSSIKFSKRYTQHKSQLLRNSHHSKKLQNHVNKYGINSLNFEIIEFCTPETLIKREQFYLDSLNPFFNTRKIAENMTGIKRTEEQKQKISQKLKGRILSEEHKNKISKANIGKILTEETKKKLSINKIGSKNHMFGKTKELHPKYGKKYKQKKSKTPKKVIDLKTNIVYNSAKEVSEKLNIPYSTVYRNLLNYNKNKKFQYYENV